jgi:putative membrane protein (TIGR04086 family)
MRKISVKGVLIGGIVDVVSSTLLGIPLAVYALSKVDMTHTPNDQLGAAILVVTHARPWLYATQLFVGLLCSVLGGYVAAWLAKHDELLNGTLSSFLCLVVGIYSIALGKDSHAHWVQFLMLVAAPICGFFGGYLRVQQRHVHTPAV